MRILHVVHYYLPKHKGGIELTVHELTKEQQAHGHDVLVLAGQGIPTIYDGVAVDILHSKNGDQYIERYLTRAKPDIIHIHQLSTIPLSFVHIAKSLKIPVIMALYDYDVVCPRSYSMFNGDQPCIDSGRGHKCKACLTRDVAIPAMHWFDGFLNAVVMNMFNLKAWIRLFRKKAAPIDYKERLLDYKKALDACDHVYTVSHLAHYAFDFHNVKIDSRIHHTAKPFATAYEKSLQPGEVIHIAFVGKLCHAKGLKVVIDAANNLPKDKFVFHIWGHANKTPRDQAYLQWMKTIAPFNVRWHGHLEREDFAEAMKRIHIGVVPSLWYETSGRITEDFLHCGVPVFCSNRAGSKEYMRKFGDQDVGWIKDPWLLDVILSGIYKNAHDLIYKYSRAAILYKPRWNVYDKVTSLYAEVCQRHSCQQLQPTNVRD